MKRYIHFIHLSMAAFTAVILCVGCSRSDEDRLMLNQIPISDFKMDFAVDGSDVYITKADQSVQQENKVTGLYILLFNEQGTLVHRKSYFVGGGQVPQGYDDQITNYTEKNSENAGASMGIIERFFDGYQGSEQNLDGDLTFYAVANYDTSLEQEFQRENLTASELENLTVSFATPGDVTRVNFLMIAKEEGVRLNATPGTGNSINVDHIGVNLQLRRVDSKISFRVRMDIPGAEDLVFGELIFRVHNVPDVTYLFERTKGTGDVNTWDAAAEREGRYSCMMEDTFQFFDSTYTDKSGGEFAFYLRETRPLPKRQIALTDKGAKSSLYALREAWEGGTTDSPTPVHNRKFTYAPEHGTFVEISGNLSYTKTNENGDKEEVNGDVTYIIHLGETGNDPNDVEAVNNYDVRRNVRYIYNVNIKGINDMEVEVYEETERRPGVEGDLIISTNRQVTFDAHYGRVILELNKDNLGENARWSSVTPFATIEYNPETGLINHPYDYKWVLFAINRQFDPDNDGTTMVKFPGIQAYDGGVQFFENGVRRSKEEIREAIKFDFGNNIHIDDQVMTFKQSLNNYYTDNYYQDKDIDQEACLRDINQLINYLRDKIDKGDFSLFNEEGIVYVTAFVDEYTYLYDPRTEDYIHPGVSAHEHDQQGADARLQLWKNYTNVGNRTLNIMPMTNVNFSPDGNTSITNAYITLTQNSIKTIYDTTDPDIETGWGLETINETGKLTYNMQHSPEGKQNNTDGDGRTNFLNFWIDQSGNPQVNWTSVMTVTQRIENANGLVDKYRDAFHACITRNRDLNGNDVIDTDEIFWYLAAKNQLDGLWIGQPSLDRSAWMYQGQGDTVNHFVTSTEHPKGSYWVLWSEEGAAWGRLQDGGDQYYTGKYDYRCIRNLGIDIADPKEPDHYASYSGPHEDGDGNRYYTVNMDKINNRVLRTSPDNGINLPPHNERSDNNMPYRSFDVLINGSAEQTPSHTWKEMRDLINSNQNPCPRGWRIPNQREYLIMMSTIPEGQGFLWQTDDSYRIGIATSFSFNGVTSSYAQNQGGTNYSAGNRYGFIHAGGNVFLHNEADENEDLRFRCVRDNTTAQ